MHYVEIHTVLVPNYSSAWKRDKSLRGKNQITHSICDRQL